MHDISTNELLSLSVGESGYIVDLTCTDEQLKRRFLDMGLTKGERVTVVGIAPFGDPIKISLRNYTLSLRMDDARNISVTKDTIDPGCNDEAFQKLISSLNTVESIKKSNYSVNTVFEPASPHLFDTSPIRPLRFALLGNPNCGKTTLFNALTGAREYVGNWPGVTVEKKEGAIKKTLSYGQNILLTDLPGIYSLSANSLEERIAERFISEERPDLIINITDATNIERNLYLTLQSLELGVHTVVAVNMMDESIQRGDVWDFDMLSQALGVPVIPISAKNGSGIEKLMESAITQISQQTPPGHSCWNNSRYNRLMNKIDCTFYELLHSYACKSGSSVRSIALRLLEGRCRISELSDLTEEASHTLTLALENFSFADAPTVITHTRYEYIEDMLTKAYAPGTSANTHSISTRIDRFVTNKYIAIPLFIAIMFSIFTLTFSSVGAWLSDTLSNFIDAVFSPFVQNSLNAINTAPWLSGLIVDGIIAGVGGVLTFLPQIALLFFLLSLLEDTGYMARIAFIMDAPMRKIGLSGKSVIPLLMGMGCTVPAAMSARTMDTVLHKRMTVLLLPFMSCSAKLPVYGLIAGAFFAKHSSLVILCLYIIGIICAVATGIIFKKTLFKNANAPFMLELPSYRIPTTQTVFIHVWERVHHFLIKAGTIILMMSILLWVLLNFDFTLSQTSDSANSILGNIGGFIAPLFTPNGFPCWQAVVALMAGIIAKESVVAALSMFYGFAADATGSVIHTAMAVDFTPASAFAFLVFVLLYTPCIAAITTMHRELESKKWTALAIALQLGSAYILSVFAYTVCGILM